MFPFCCFARRGHRRGSAGGEVESASGAEMLNAVTPPFVNGAAEFNGVLWGLPHANTKAPPAAGRPWKNRSGLHIRRTWC